MMGARRVFVVILICTTATLAEAGLFSSEDGDESSLKRQRRTTCTSTFDCPIDQTCNSASNTCEKLSSLFDNAKDEDSRGTAKSCTSIFDCPHRERCNLATNTCQKFSSLFDSSEHEDIKRTAQTMAMVPIIIGLVIFFLVVTGIGITIYFLMRRSRPLLQSVMATNPQQTWVVSTQQQQQPGYGPPGTYPPQGTYPAQQSSAYPPAYPVAAHGDPPYHAAAGTAPYPIGTVPYPAPPAAGFVPSEDQRLNSPASTNQYSNQPGLPPPYDNYRGPQSGIKQ